MREQLDKENSRCREKKDLREEVGTKACIVAKIGWTHGQNERWEITETIWHNEARRLQKTRKTTAKMGGLSEERYEKGRG